MAHAAGGDWSMPFKSYDWCADCRRAHEWTAGRPKRIREAGYAWLEHEARAAILAAGTPTNITVYVEEYGNGTGPDGKWGFMSKPGQAYDGWDLGTYVWVPEKDGRDLFSAATVLLMDSDVETIKYGLVAAKTNKYGGPFLRGGKLRFEGDGDELLARAVALLGEGARPDFYDVE